MTPARPRSPRRSALVTMAALFAATGCSFADDSDAAPSPAVPTPPAREAALCRALHRALPERVDGLARRDTAPASDLTAAWGVPAVELRCGVPKPDVLTPGTEHYNPKHPAVEINGVEWLLEESDEGYRFTTVLRKTFVEVWVPAAHAPEVNVLTDLAKPVRKTIPFGI
ncbi:DUF3515 domain-containing protein [Streptomyces sp. LX-29]|uniref:DUF3515 domain-containing protein n=1 Tax=Streptomyces sp. LX-29 TaxID=2900152 RepID=UPI00240D37E7|nr:DUF3515 domain-containing protein [Streptomyces sp. LX-29]WFB07207.1 DUF3515 domain-containing protein [Streptomyces sp. LX-29]